MTPRDEAIEVLARALCQKWMSNEDEDDGLYYWRSFANSLDEAVEREWRGYIPEATAALDALLALQAHPGATWRVVPGKATAGMCDVGYQVLYRQYQASDYEEPKDVVESYSAFDAYSAMLAAAPNPLESLK